MKLVTYRTPEATQAGRVEDDQIISLAFSDVGALLSSGDDWMSRAAEDGPSIALSSVSLAPTILQPSKIFCLGLNYLDHINEAVRTFDASKAEYPTLFAKFADSLAGPNDTIVVPNASNRVDWETEMVVVIGSAVRNATEEQAVASIAGYATGNDISMRDWQKRTTEWLQGKVWEASTPLGALVTADEVGGDGRPDLQISCALDGVEMQNSRTSLLIFDAVDAIRYASTIVTLRPGDLIFTGTCSGVGFARKPPIYIQPGQTLTTRIEKLGECVNAFIGE